MKKTSRNFNLIFPFYRSAPEYVAVSEDRHAFSHGGDRIKRAALYLRVSTIDQHPETQGIELRQFAKQRGYQIVEEYVDHGVSGTKVRRPALDRLLKDANRHKFDAVLVWSSDRLARSTKHFLQVLDELNELGIQFLSQREAIDTEGPLGSGDRGHHFCNRRA